MARKPVKPQLAHTRAKLGAATRDVGRGRKPETVLTEARRAHQAALAQVAVDAYVQQVIDAAPLLSSRQKAALAELLAPAREHIARQRLAADQGAAL